MKKMAMFGIAFVLSASVSVNAGNFIFTVSDAHEILLSHDPSPNSTNPHYGGDGAKISGYLVHTDTTVAFFKNAIKQVGADGSSTFITFRSPNIIDQKYALIQFEIDEEFAKKILNTGGVNSKPEHLKNVYMVFATDQKNIANVEEITKVLESFDMEGYQVLEWVNSAIPKATIIDAL